MQLVVKEMLGGLRGLLNVPAARALRRDWTKRLKALSGRELLAIAEEVQRHGETYGRFLATELIHFHPEARSLLNAATLRRLGEGMASWDAVDVFACFLSGPAWREGEINDAEIHRWAKSPDRWWRRAALVSTVTLNNKTRGGAGDPERTLAVCAMLIQDRDDMVVKAFSWALRELAKRDAASVRRFVERHREVLAARVVREVGNKLRTGKKNPGK